MKCAAIAIVVVIVVIIVVIAVVGGKLALDVPVSEGLAAPLTFLAAAHDPKDLVSECSNFLLEARLTNPSTKSGTSRFHTRSRVVRPTRQK